MTYRLAPRPPLKGPTITDYLAGRERVHGPHGVWSRIAAHLGLPWWRYPERMPDWIASGLIPPKFWQSLEYNQELNLCCRHMENMTAAVYKSNPRLPHPDIFNVRCACGRNHIRVRADPVRHGINESPKDRVAGATSILEQPHHSGVSYHG